MATQTNKPLSKAKLQKIVDRFNAAFPVGTAVMLRKDSGEVATAVRSPAEILSGHSAVAWFTGIGGCYSIEDDRVRRAAPEIAAGLANVGGAA